MILVPELGLRGNKKLQAMLEPFLREHSYLSAAQIARRWIASQEFWAPGSWLKGLLSRPDRVEVMTRAVALLISHEEQVRSRRLGHRHGRQGFRPGHASRLRGGALPPAGARQGVRASR